MSIAAGPPPSKWQAWRERLVILAALALPLASTLPPVRAAMVSLVVYMRHAGAAGVALYAAVSAIAALALVPVSILSALAGFAYGPVRGILAASPIGVVGATAAFIVGRTFLRAPLSRRVAVNPKWAAVDAAIAARGFRIALLLRLSPFFPQNFLSYALSATRLGIGAFARATFLGLLPITCFYVYVGTLVGDASEVLAGAGHPRGPWRWATLAAGLVVSAAALAGVARIARNELRKALGDNL